MSHIYYIVSQHDLKPYDMCVIVFSTCTYKNCLVRWYNIDFTSVFSLYLY